MAAFGLISAPMLKSFGFAQAGAGMTLGGEALAELRDGPSELLSDRNRS
jgi:hypothetical protein